jgi:hypothetical protein
MSWQRIARGAGVVAVALAAVGSHGPSAQQNTIPAPRDILGFTPGDDFRLADYGQMQEYFRRLDAASDRVRLERIGASTEGREMFIAVITSEANFARLDRYKQIARRLAMARDLSSDEARALAREGKTIVWIDSGLHAAETGPAQHAFLLAHRMATDESEESRRIRDNVVLVLAPCLEPDGLERVVDWYRRTVNTPHRDSPMPWLFNKYVSYENNRDHFMLTQLEAQHIARLLYFEWLPQIVYNHHQGFYPSRIFVPPFPDPFNPNIDAGVIRGIELVGAAMQHRYEREGKDGVLTRFGFSSWYNGSLRTTTYFHNMIGILTETTHDTPTPFFYDPATRPAEFGNGWSTSEPSTNYPRPWLGGWLRFRDVLDYMLTGSLGVLDVGARYREDFLYGVYQIASRQIELGKTQAPIAYVIPPEQHDPPVVARFVEVLMRGGVEVHRADASFAAAGQRFPSGSYVIRLAQPFRPLVKDLLEPQRHPDLRAYRGGPPIPPYDNAGWTLSYQMGVRAVPIDAALDAALSRVETFPVVAGSVSGPASYGYAIDPRANNAVTAIARLLAAGFTVARATGAVTIGSARWPAGAVIVRTQAGVGPALAVMATELGIEIRGLDAEPEVPTREIRQRRIGVYKSYVTEWVADWTAAEGFTRFLFDRYEVPYSSILNAEMRRGDLGQRFDTILIPDQAVEDIVGGYRQGRRQFERPHQELPPPEYVGGLEAAGVAALRRFVEAGGTLILVDRACDLATEQLELPVRNAVKGIDRTEFFVPGSIVAVTVDGAHPLGYGMPARAAAYFQKSRAFDVAAADAKVVARYVDTNVLMSGWMVGERHMAGKAAIVEVPLGSGRVVLLGFSPYYRAQPHGTFKLLFNALY